MSLMLFPLRLRMPMTQNKKKYKLVRFGEELKPVVTKGGFAEIVGKSLRTIKEYEKRRIIPEANFVMENGYNGYTVELAKAVAPHIAQIQQGVPVSEELKSEIRKLFYQEKVELKL